METTVELLSEPLLTEDRSRFTLMPIRYPSIYKRYKDGRASSWEAHEVDFSQDKIDMAKSLTDAERRTVLTIVAFFQVADGIVSENIVVNLFSKIMIPEVRLFYAMQLAQEAVHIETYSLTLEALVDSVTEREKLLDSISHIPAIARKTDWSIKWMQQGNFSECLIAFAFAEGVHFSGSFCGIFWLKKRGLMPGLTFSNELISREEKLHCDFAIELYHMLTVRPGDERIVEIMIGCVDAEKEFVNHAISEPLVGMNATMMCQYIEFVADRLLVACDVKPIYKTPNPFNWMNLMGIPGRASFFEKKVANYTRRGEAPSISKIEYNENGF